MKQVTIAGYQTSDGKVHLTKDDAEMHQLEQAREALGTICGAEGQLYSMADARKLYSDLGTIFDEREIRMLASDLWSRR